MTVTQPKYGRTFPLYLTPIDWCFLADDSVEYPMVFYVDLDFSGRLSHDKMSEALVEACHRHPLMYSVIQRAKQNKLCWVLAPEQMPEIKWGAEGEPLDFDDGDYIDIQKNTGLRIWVRESDSAARMTMQFHHSVCDGTGAYRFVGDLLACYMQKLDCCQGKVELGEFKASQLKIRPTKMRTLKSNEGAFTKFRKAAGEAWKQFGVRVTPLTKPPTKPESRTYPGMVKHTFSSQDLASLRSAATERGATMNDLLLCRMFQTAIKWNEANTKKQEIRILVPSDMRDQSDFEMPACNMTAYTFITRTDKEIADEAQLLELVRQDTLQIKNGNLQTSFINGLTSAMAVPWFLPWLMRRNRCLATSILSNAGDPSRRFTCRLPKRKGKVSCDEFTLEGITGVPPLRRVTRCTLSSSIYGRQLTFSMRCDPHVFTQPESQKLLDLFCNQIRLDL